MPDKCSVSIIVPLYNEELRTRPFLKELSKYSDKDWEVILVDDGSTDRTLEIIKQSIFPKRKIISYKKNMGKGYAVKLGVEVASGDYIIFIDADGSIHPSQISSMLYYLKKYDVVVANRNAKESYKKATLFRVFVGNIFNTYARVLFNIPASDNLCGFKGFKKEIAKSLFHNLISKGWIFDVELFYRIKEKNHSLYMLPIKWVHKTNSKMGISDVLKIAIEMIILKIKLFRASKARKSQIFVLLTVLNTLH